MFSGAARPFPVELETLSPSDPSIRTALAQVRRWIPQPGQLQRRIVNRSPNHASVVLWVRAGDIRALLGADLEQTGQADEGWSAVISCHDDPILGHLFKVPHHGSINSDHPDVWERMLGRDAFAVVTPFAGGRVRLPKSSDLERLAARTSRLYCTIAGTGRPPRRDNAVERMMKTQLADRHVIDGQPGHVRVRWKISQDDSTSTVEVFNGAYSVS